jgi:hypothetical protein
MSTAEIESTAPRITAFARAIGVNIFPAPVHRSGAGSAPWLEGRRLLFSDPDRVVRIGGAFIRGV